MKKVTKVLSTLFPSFFVLGLSLGAVPFHKPIEEAGEDTAIYDDGPSVVTYDANVNRNNAAGEEDPDEDVTVEVDKVILHYYNEAGGNSERAFYLWVTGVDGKEYNTKFGPTYNPGGIMVVDDATNMMTITIDFSTEEFAEFANRSGLYFIIKYALKSETDLNWGGQSDDMFIRYADYPQAVSSDKVCELWTMPAAGGGIAILDSEAKTKVHGVALAKFTDWKTIHCTLTSDTTTVNWKLYAYDQTYYRIKPKNRAAEQKWYLVKEGTGTGDFDIKFKYEAHINMVYSLESHDPSTDSTPGMAELSKVVTVGLDNLYDSAKFHKYYEEANANKTLGMTYSADATTFRVWSPVSANMKVLIYDKDTSSEYCGSTDPDVKKAYDKYDSYQMQYTTGGIWELTIQGLPEGKYYNFQVDNSLGTNVIMDPYATSAGANGLRGLVYDKNGTKVTPTGWSSLPTRWDGTSYDITSPQDLTIYEVHIQDFTGDASWNGPVNERGTYNGFVHKGTHLDETDGSQYWMTTGYDHLNGLGVNAVQIMPTFDHDNNEVETNGQTPKYNWGYNPLNYNVPEGIYSSNPHDGYARVKEFRNMVLELSKTEAHTRTIMDVVYNHVSSATGSNFHKLMPRYYFRYAMKDYTYYWEEGGVTKSSTVHQGELWDGSGCHNEVASERPMMRKFIVDSLCMWAKDYKIKGFRFDLMGLIDFETMNAARKALYAIDPDIYIYGEGWTSGGYHGPGSSEYNEYYKEQPHNYGAWTWQVYNECNNYEVPGGIILGGFNDNFRNAVRGENDAGGHYPGMGWVQGGNWCNSTSFRTDLVSSVVAGLWGMNLGVHGNGEVGNNDNTGCFPEQTVNYVSCHDNFTLRDQLFQTLLSRSVDPISKNDIAEVMLRASIQAHTLTFASNGVAFILGGEEFLRTKTIPESLIDKITDKSSYVDMYGNHISHNSYNSPLEINTFKWDQKKEISVTVNGEVTQTITNATYNYCDTFKGLIKIHNQLSKLSSTSTVHRIEDFYRLYPGFAGASDEEVWSWIWWAKNGQDLVGASNCVAINVFGNTVYSFVGPGLYDTSGNYLKDGARTNSIFNYGDFNLMEYTTDQYQPTHWNTVKVFKA